MSKLILLTYDTNHSIKSEKGSLYFLLKSATKRNWKYTAIGDNEEWMGFGQKILKLIEIIPILIKEHGKDLILVITDARDVIVNRSSRNFVKTFHEIRKNKKIVFGSEIGCCVHPMTEFPPGSFISKKKRKKKAIGQKNWNNIIDNHNYTESWIKLMGKNKQKINIKDDWFRALNAGMYCGYATSILYILKRFLPLNLIEDDQALWSDVMYTFPQYVMLDYNQELFSNAHTWDSNEGCFFRYNNQRKSWMNTRTKTYPFFIQTPASKIDNFKCYKTLIKKIT